MPTDTSPGRIDHDRRSFRYYRNAVERHWDPHEIDLETDREAIQDVPKPAFDGLRETLALFGAGEEAVTEDLSPLGVVLEDVADQLFVTTQLYEEAKHADFFDRYWGSIITPEEERRGLEPTAPTDERWFPDPYEELFERNEEAMHKLLLEDTPENRALAYCHYHMAIEGILAQTGYYGVQTNFSGEYEELPRLPGLVEGFSRIRSDEGRHVGFGMWKLKTLVQEEGVDPGLIEETIGELAMLVQRIVGDSAEEDAIGVDDDSLVSYAAAKHHDRMAQIVDDDSELPAVEELVALEE
ncbi:ribonucleotide-diphosphate reductase subunit beta [Natronobacterium texcoconense]|uniref:Ribonucleoside-diphosphate reductase beta chain n=1 Tax=Natronobacterium texcoconense TaxID=1095778 RepID=A0A1H1H481_NATTX|nr:ribonucleotide-diphosphate reductase subunit beta [Natronobacterium texcoconense]SDR20153.1 ribonucleoside-diphosphate reductase beta chain [Natronobacterium texcoconense]